MRSLMVRSTGAIWLWGLGALSDSGACGRGGECKCLDFRGGSPCLQRCFPGDFCSAWSLLPQPGIATASMELCWLDSSLLSHLDPHLFLTC